MQKAPRDPEQAEALGAPANAQLPASTRMGEVQLTVADLSRSIAYYERALGLRVRERAGGRARLGAGEGMGPDGPEDLLVLVERPGARPVRGFCGLYHFALLLPRRVDLARWLAHAGREGVALVGASDHFVSEAIYLSDPDGHGIEIYWDRPRELWEGKVAQRMTTFPLDLADLLGELDGPDGLGHPASPGDPTTGVEPFQGLSAGTTMGHVHLCVADIAGTVAFYRDLLGFAVMASVGAHATFLSAGGYHHHLGANTWESAGAPQPPPGSAALRHMTIVLPTPAERDSLIASIEGVGHEPREHESGALVYDPSGNAVLLASR